MVRFQDFGVSGLRFRIEVSRILGFNLRFQGFLALKFQSFEIVRFQGLKVYFF
jgi:hypothetical protein